MAEDLNTLISQLKQIEKSAEDAKQRIASLSQELQRLIQTSAKGGTPTEQRVLGVTENILAGQQPLRRTRLGGGARVDLGKLQTDINRIVSQYAQESINQFEAEIAAKAKRKEIDVHPQVVQAGGTVPAEGTISKSGKSVQTLSNQLKELGKIYGQDLVQNIEKAIGAWKKADVEITKVAVKPLKADEGFQKLNVTLTSGKNILPSYIANLDALGKEVDQLAASSQKAAETPIGPAVPPGWHPPLPGTGEVATEVSPEAQKLVQDAAAKTGKSVADLSKQLKELGKIYGQDLKRNVDSAIKSWTDMDIAITKVSVKPQKAAEGFQKLQVTLGAGRNTLEPYIVYLDKFGKEVGEAEAAARKAIPTLQQLEESMGRTRFQKGVTKLGQYGFTPDDITKVYTQQPSGVTFITAQKEVEGVMNRVQLAVDKTGKTIVQTNRRLLDFFSAIARNTAEVIRWSIGATAVYQALFKLQDLVRVAIDNQAKLADITVVLGNNQRNVNEIFRDAAVIAKETGESLNGVLEAYSSAYRAVGAIEDPLQRTTAANKLLTDAITLNKLSNLDAAQSIDVLSGALRQIQRPGETTAQVFERGTELLDKWVAVTRRANVDMATLATAFSITAESADAAGASTEELNAVIAVLSEKIGGLGGRETGNAVRALIGGPYQGQAAETLGRFGVAVQYTTGQMRPFLEISREINELWRAGFISDDQLLKIAYTLGGGVRRGQQYVAFLKDLSRVEEIVAVQAQVGGAAQEALGKKLDTVQTASTRLSNAFQELAQSLGGEGGVLDATTGVLNTITLLSEGISALTRLLGRITVPATLLALAGLYFRGPEGKLRGEQYTGNIAGMFGGMATRALGMFPGMGNEYIQRTMLARGGGMMVNPTGMTNAQNLGQRFGQFAGQYGPALALGSFPAISRAGAGQWKEAGIDMAGAIIGALVGGPVGAVIGSAIADTFVSETISYKGEFQNLFKDIFPKAPTEPTEEEEADAEKLTKRQEELTKQMFEDLGGIWGEGLGKFKARLGALGTNILLGGYGVTQRAAGREYRFEGVTPEQFALAQPSIRNPFQIGKITPEQQKYIDDIKELQRITPAEIKPPEIIATDEEKRYIEELQDQLRQSQLQSLYKGEIKPREYLDEEKVIQGLLALLPQLESAFGDTFDQISDDVSGTEDVYKEFADALLSGASENVDYIKQLAGEIETLKAGIEEIKKTGQTSFKFGDDVLTLAAALDLLPAKIEAAAQAMAALRREQTAVSVQLPEIISLDTQAQYVNQIIAEATRLEDIYLAALTPDERTKYEAEQTAARTLLEIWAKGGSQFYQEIENAPGADFITRAFENLTSKGKVPEMGQQVGLQKFDMPYAQFAQQMTGYEALLAKLKPLGYQRDEQYQIAMFNDGIIRPMSKDWKIVQFLLQEILDVNKKQLEGVYNLPSDASFYVPFQGYELGFGQGGGGLGGINWESIPGDMEDSTYRGTYQGILDSMGFANGEERKRAREERSSILKEKTTMSPADIKKLEYPLTTPQQVPEITVPEQKPSPFDIRSIPGYAPELEVPEPEGIDLVGITIENAIKSMSTSLDTKLGEANKHLQGILDAVNRLAGVEPGKPLQDPLGKGLRGLQSPTQATIAYLNQTKEIPKVETKLSLNINSTSQLLVDGRLMAAVVKQYLYEDLLRSQGISGTNSMTITI